MIQPSQKLSLVMLIAFNIYLIVYYQQHPEKYGSLLLLYWLQSVSIGIFHWVTMVYMVIRNKKTATPETQDKQGVFPLLFFPIHYGGFHLGYLLFIVIQNKLSFDPNFLLISLAIILLSDLFDFRAKIGGIKSNNLKASQVFFLPYLRILPMHLALMGAAFLIFDNKLVFLILKTLADVLMFNLTNRIYFKKNTS